MPPITTNLDEIPIFFFFFVAIFLYSIRNDLNNIEEIKWKLGETVFFIIVFLFIQFVACSMLNTFFKIGHDTNKQLLLAFFYVTSTLNLVSVLILFPAIFNLDFAVKFYKRHEAKILLNLAVFLVATIFATFLLQNWLLFSETAASSVVKILQNSSFVTDPVWKTPVVTYKTFSANIGAPCSGVTSLSLFLFVFSALVINNYKKFNLGRTTLFLIIGTIGMFLVNILRITILMWIGGTISKEIALNLFHDYAGWIFYLIYILVVVRIFFVFALKKKKN